MSSKNNKLFYASLAVFMTAVLSIVTYVALTSKHQNTLSNSNNGTQPHCDTTPVTHHTPTHQGFTNSLGQARTPVKQQQNTQPLAVPSTQQNTLTLKTGTAVPVYDLNNLHQPAAELVPIYNQSQLFGSYAVYQDNDTGIKQLVGMLPMPEPNANFPNVSLEQANNLLTKFNPNYRYQYQGKLVYLFDPQMPLYYFTAFTNARQPDTFLVNALTGEVEKLDAKELQAMASVQKLQDNGQFITLNAQGMLTLTEAAKQALPKFDREMLELENAHINTLIDKGLVRIDSQGDIVEDNSTEADWDALADAQQKLFQRLDKEGDAASGLYTITE